MGTRHLVSGILAAALAVACSDSFGPEDALGIWDLQRFNGAAVPGDVWARQEGGDSIQVGIDALHFEFLTGPSCSYSITPAGQAPIEFADCSYLVTDDGDVNVILLDNSVFTGTGDGDDLTLTDHLTNVLEFHKRQ